MVCTEKVQAPPPISRASLLILLVSIRVTPSSWRRRAGAIARHSRQRSKSPASYVGMVGSRKKIAKLRHELSGDIPAERLATLHGPAGLDIGAIEPEEIVISILGGDVGERRRRNRACAHPKQVEA